MRSLPISTFALAAVCAGAALSAPPVTSPTRGKLPAPGPEVEFFERQVRPVLVEQCFSCHGPKLQHGGLRLDSRAALLKGGANGPSLVPGDPGKSRLLQAIRHEGPLKMPPAGKLKPAQIAALEHWVAAGAVWPESAAPVAGPSITDKGRTHWAFQPVRRPAVPRVKNAAWVRNPVDAFVLARLEKAGLSPSAPADPRTLLRRLYIDLIGVPPTHEETEAFFRDSTASAYERVVDRLLADPRYGERWGRHWLDVARYADSKDGVLMYGDARIRPYAYTYRDYVIRALNEDTPYNQFIHEQLAADQIQPKVESWRLAGMGFLTLGRMFDNNIHDVIDDRIDTVTRGMMGLTVACARCHDHKYDPIPTADYYSLYGVFASSETPVELPLIEEAKSPEAIAFEQKAAAKRNELRQFLGQQYQQQSEAARQRVGDYLARAALEQPDPLETAIFFLSLSPEDLRPPMVASWRRFLAARSRPDDAVFGPWHELMKLPDTGFPEAASGVLQRFRARPAGTGAGQLNPRVLEALSAAKLTDRRSVAQAYGELLKRTHEEAKGKSPDAASRQLLDLLTAPSSPAFIHPSQTWNYMSRGEKDQYGSKLVELDLMAVGANQAPGRAMVLQDSEVIQEPRIFIRGNPSSPGDFVPRRFLTVASGPRREPFRNGSGRLDLARSITAPENPVTARVMVNRVWMEHFGEPLVSTPSDFGLRSNPPTHPELLDWLASSFTAGDFPTPNAQHPAPAKPWSLKALHRLLVLSNTYRQASFDRPACRTKDPENRLLWRANRRRLDLEAMRDSMLAVSGRLDPTMYGRPVDVAGDFTSGRRTVYGMVDRQGLPGLFRAFDFASPDASAERRPRTTVPQQALFGLNSPFVLQQARTLAARPEVTRETDPAARVAALYRLILSREPKPAEVTGSLRFLQPGVTPAANGKLLSPWELYAQVLLLTNEFMFVD
jgi:mono/diheme cytochrome c family protein